jgi:hypothetical protein
MSIRSFPELKSALAADRAALVEHSLYARLTGLRDVRVFMEHHAFAVWDFMSLLKSLQREVTCVGVPWVPRGDPTVRRLVNEIVLAEESDDGVSGTYTSHFELYRAAMVECGADVSRVDAFVERISRGQPLLEALLQSEVPEAARLFVLSTFATIETGSVPRIAAAFTIGREDIIPAMFVRLVEGIGRSSGTKPTLLSEYLNRHVSIDGDRHGPIAAQLLDVVCGTDSARWTDALMGARDALVARAKLWDRIEKQLGRPSQLASSSGCR